MNNHRHPVARKQLLVLLILATTFSVQDSTSTEESSNEPSGSPETDHSIQLANDPIEYDEVTGKPICINCHTSDRRPAITYIYDPECRQCHESDYSERFLDIDERYKVSIAEATERYRHYASIDRPMSDATNKTPEPTASTPEGMVLVPGGVFIMGTDDWWPKSGPEHKRELPDYFIDIYEVTNKEYKAFVDATRHRAPEHWKQGRIPSGRENHPVTFVDWFDATAYCEWKDKRLPAEAEWEKAARGTDGRSFPWGNEFDKNKANTPQYGHKDTLPIGEFEAGKSPYGAYDMAGNVFEWTADWYKAHPGNKHPDPNEGERYRVVKGGSWFDCTFYKCGISAPTFNRIFFNPFTLNNNFGFRCVLSVE